MSVEVLSVEYFQSGSKIGKRGNAIKVIQKRLTLLCHECGKVYVRSTGMWAAKQKSCGCSSARFVSTHGMSNTPIYEVWHGMRTRCLNRNDKNYPRYGGRGITICSDWDNFESFYVWAVSKGWKRGLLIDRKNNDGNYNPSNCVFSTPLESNRNKSDVHMDAVRAKSIKDELETKSNKELAVKYGTTRCVVKNIRSGISWRNV